MMDREPDEMRNLGVVGICKEAYNILQLHICLFLSLALTLVLPLGAVIFCHSLITHPLWKKISHNQDELHMEQPNSPQAAATQHLLDAELFVLGVVTVLYVVFVLAFSLLSTAAIVYSVASIYTAKGLSYVKVLSVVPKVWKRLFFTFLWAHVIIFLYYFAFFITIILLISLLGTGITALIPGVAVVVVFYCFLIYFNLVWHLASVVSVLEDSYGIGALKKSVDLIKGKRWVACVVFLLYAFCTFLVLTSYNHLVSGHHHHHMRNMVGRVFLGLVLLILWTAVTLIGILVQTVVYFVCKSYHHESIDRYALSEHLDGYLGEYMPLKGPVSLEALEAELEEI